MNILTNEHRKLVRRRLDLYMKAPLYPVSAKAERRVSRWAYGETITEIAKSEGVGKSRVSRSVSTVAWRILESIEEAVK